MQRVAHVLFTFKIFLAFRVVVALWLRPLDKMICMSDEGITSIQTNTHTHTHTPSQVEHMLSAAKYAALLFELALR